MKEIGGYFELECQHGKMWHPNGGYVNSGSNALRLAVRTYQIKKLYVPDFTCPVVWNAVRAENCECSFYHVGDDFLPDREFASDDYILYNNYFGICSKQVDYITQKYSNVIIDNAQAFYMPHSGIASIYSPRKFFGVPDGGILTCNKNVYLPQERSMSWNRCLHLLKRHDSGASAAYTDFKQNDEALALESPMKISALTEAMLRGIDYKSVRQKRLENFNYIHAHLRNKNKLSISLTENDIPMVYPFLCDGAAELRQKLINNKIFVAKYWSGIENPLTEILPLPIDQRYDLNNMRQILECLNMDAHTKVYIRPLKREDAFISFKWRNDPTVWKYTGRRPDRYITEEIELAWIEKALADATCRRFAICTCDSDKYIGNVQLTDITESSAQFHIFIGDRSFWGKGVASQATELLINYIKEHMSVTEVLLSVHPDNTAAQKVYLKNGFNPIDDKVNMILKIERNFGGVN